MREAGALAAAGESLLPLLLLLLLLLLPARADHSGAEKLRMAGSRTAPISLYSASTRGSAAALSRVIEWNTYSLRECARERAGQRA